MDGDTSQLWPLTCMLIILGGLSDGTDELNKSHEITQNSYVLTP